MIIAKVPIFCTTMALINLLKLCHCEMSAKIVGGVNGTIELFPHAVFLHMKCGDQGFICGSSVLNQRILITAAHCVVECNVKTGHKVNAFGGNEDRKSQEALTRKVVDIISHSEYVEHHMKNDIALAELEKPFPLCDHIKRVIMSKKFPIDVKEASVAGWGIVDDITRKKQYVMKYVKQPLVPWERCSELITLYPGMLCAGSDNATTDHPSRGDSGSGLVTSSYIQIGLVSFRVHDWPALIVYTNVTFFYKWIQTNSKTLVCT